MSSSLLVNCFFFFTQVTAKSFNGILNLKYSFNKRLTFNLLFLTWLNYLRWFQDSFEGFEGSPSSSSTPPRSSSAAAEAATLHRADPRSLQGTAVFYWQSGTLPSDMES